MMPPGGAAARADMVDTLAAHAARARDRPGARPPARRAGAVGGVGGPRLRRRAAGALGAARLREGRPRARRPRGGDLARQGRRRCRPGLEALRRLATTRRFRDALARHVELRHAYIACFDGRVAHPYDVLLDDFEPGLTTAELRPMFARAARGARPARRRHRRPRAAAQRRRLPRARSRRTPAARSPCTSCSTPSATTPSTGAWTRRCTRSRAAWRRPTCA